MKFRSAKLLCLISGFVLSSCGFSKSSESTISNRIETDGSASHGGDPLAIMASAAQEKARFVVSQVSEIGSTFALKEDEREWFRKNRVELANDLRNTKLEWADKLPESCEIDTCACTSLARDSTIFFSFDTCRKQNKTEDDLVKLLIHETVHHFGVKDENFANRISSAVWSDWLNMFSLTGKRTLLFCSGVTGFDQFILDTDGNKFHVTINSILGHSGIEKELNLPPITSGVSQVNFWFPISSCSFSNSLVSTLSCQTDAAEAMLLRGPEDITNLSFLQARDIKINFDFDSEFTKEQALVRFTTQVGDKANAERRSSFFKNTCLGLNNFF